MKTAIVAGASGLVGEQLIKELLADPGYSKIIAVVRKSMDTRHEKLEQMIIDFGHLPSSLNGIIADHGYCCLGTTIKTAGSKERQFRIDHDYVIDFAGACHTAGVTRFAVVSSIGAKASSSNFYLRTKGTMEQNLKRIPFAALFILQPSLLMGKRKERRFGEKAAIFMMKAIGQLMFGSLKKYRGVDASKVAQCMISCIHSSKEGISIIRSDQI